MMATARRHQLSVRHEAAHIRASRFKLIKILQGFLRFGAGREGIPMKLAFRAGSAKTCASNDA
jgi:hypothetical protein